MRTAPSAVPPPGDGSEEDAVQWIVLVLPSHVIDVASSGAAASTGPAGTTMNAINNSTSPSDVIAPAVLRITTAFPLPLNISLPSRYRNLNLMAGPISPLTPRIHLVTDERKCGSTPPLTPTPQEPVVRLLPVANGTELRWVVHAILDPV